MKAAYLIDECVGGKKLKRVLPGTLTVNDIGLQGEPDEKIFRKSQKMNLTTITKDNGFVFYSLVHNTGIIFVDSKNNWHMVTGYINVVKFDTKELFKTYGDPITRYLITNEEIIVP